MDDWSHNFRRTLFELQIEYNISNTEIINSLSNAMHCKNGKSERRNFRWCKIRLSFENAVYHELPFYPGCYGILADIIRDEIEKHQEGLSMPRGEFLVKIDLLVQLISRIARRWAIRERSEKELAIYFNSLANEEKRRIPSDISPTLYNGFIKRWNRIYDPFYSKHERFNPGISLQPEEKRRKVTSNADLDQLQVVNQQPAVDCKSTAPQTFPNSPCNSNPPTPTFDSEPHSYVPTFDPPSPISGLPGFLPVNDKDFIPFE
uniref:Uncharacterized protein n=1 Tax=Marseillevirus LCMAC101 TaxID=2506602 RepID=A0A481YTF7_9VIRU|nr:MAG: hypothetical protein LCMAC101_03910 [Marseillevirus LCMAC101]